MARDLMSEVLPFMKHINQYTIHVRYSSSKSCDGLWIV